jgi:hypothetical protein
MWRIFAGFIGLFLLSLLFPETFWGMNYFSLVPFAIQGITLILIMLSFQMARNKGVLDGFLSWQVDSWFKALGITIFFGIIFYQFTFFEDAYGDAPRHKAFLGESVKELNANRISQVFSLNVLQPKIGEITVLNAVELISYHYGVKVVDVFRWIGVVFGMLYVFFWLRFTQYYFKTSKVKNGIVLLGIAAPFIQLFFGHVEIYAPAITMTTLTLIAMLVFLKERKVTWGIGMLIALFLAMKFHVVSVLMVPACILSWLVYFKSDFEKWFTWKRLWLWIILPVVLIGVAAYVFVFKDHVDPRFLNGEIDTSERLFLPLFSPEPPLDRYNLFSWSHIWDYMNILFLWSVAGIFILIVAFYKRKNVGWKDFSLLLLGMTLLFYLGLFFMVNPLLSMPVDWDLFSLPAPIFVMFISVVFNRFKDEGIAKSMIVPIVVLSLLTIPIISVNASQSATSKRLEYLGRYTFKNYWIRSVETLRLGIAMDPKNYERRLLANVQKLKPYALKHNDREYANLLWRTGQYYRKNGNAEEALKWHLESRNYDTSLDYNRIGIVESYYLLGEYEDALEESLGLIEVEYPSRERAMTIAFDCALKANDSAVVVSLGRELADLYPEENYYAEEVRNYSR